MSAKISKWLLEGIDETALEAQDIIQPLETDASYHVSPYYALYNEYSNYSDYSDYYNYGVYYDYYNYSVYYNYYNYSNYSNSISITLNPISQSTLLNETVTFSVAASNTIDSCQWYRATSATATGIAIAGATSPTYTVVATRDLQNTYYYCIVRRGGNSATSSRALLTIRTLSAFDVYLSANGPAVMFFVRGEPPITEIASIAIADESIAILVDGNRLQGLTDGTTICTVTGTNGATATFKITVLPETLGNVLASIFLNIANAVREYRGITNSLYPNQMANSLRGNAGSVQYTNLEELFSDIANAIREKDGTVESIEPHNLHYRILSLTSA